MHDRAPDEHEGERHEAGVTPKRAPDPVLDGPQPVEGSYPRDRPLSIQEDEHPRGGGGKE